MSLQLAAICNSIAGLTVTGLTILDIDEIPDSWDGRAPVMYPEPVNLVTNFTAENASFGVGSGSSWNVEYDLTYTLLYANMGAGRGMEMFAPTMALAFAFWDALMASNPLTGAVTCKPVSIDTAGPVSDPSGVMFFGVKMTLHVLEFVN